MNATIYTSSIGPIAICEEGGSITNLFLNAGDLKKEMCLRQTSLLKEAAEQIGRYLEGELTAFSLPLAPHGTPFMKEVWACLCRIPYGQTATYRDIAEKVGRPSAYRAVGSANHNNPIPLLIPCHRVVGSDGSLKGYLGGRDLKQRLHRA